MKPCVLYFNDLSGKSKISDEAIHTVVDQLKQFAESKGYSITRTYIDTVQFGGGERPQFDAMINYLSQSPGNHIVVAVNPMQLCHSISDMNKIEESSAGIHLLEYGNISGDNCTSVGQILFELMVSKNQYFEKMVKAERIYNGS